MTITADGGLTLKSKFGIQENASTSINLLVDRGADVGGNSVIDLTAQYGAATSINLTAKSGSAYAPIPLAAVNILAEGNTTLVGFAPRGGAVNITANAGSGSGTAVIGYGQITLTANSFSATQPGFIKMTAGSNALYAGAYSPGVGIYGQNFIYGQLGNSFVAATTPPVLPALLQTNYFYGGLGDVAGHSGYVTGNNMVGGLGVDFIQPKTLYGDLYIQGTAGGLGIQMSDCKVLNMSTSGAINNVGNINLSSINGGTYLSTIPGNIGTNSLTVSSITASTASISTLTTRAFTVSSINGGSYLSTVVAPANISNNSLTTNSIYASTIVVTSEFRTSTINSLSSINGAVYPPVVPVTSTFNDLYTSSFFVSTVNNASYPPVVPVTSTFNQLYTSSFFVSTVNGASYPPPATSVTSTFNQAFTSSLNTSSIVFVGAPTLGTAYDITKSFTSTTTTYDSVSSLKQNILNYTMTLNSLPESFDMGGFFEVTLTNRALWLNKLIIYSGVFNPGQTPALAIATGAYTAGDFFDLKNTTASIVVNVWNPYESGGFLLAVLGNTFYRFTYSGSVWNYAINPTETSQTSINLFQVQQGWDQTTISTNNILNINAGETNITGFTNIDVANINSLTTAQTKATVLNATTANISSLAVSSIIGLPVTSTFSTLTASTFNAQNASISSLTVSSIIGIPLATTVSTYSTLTASTFTTGATILTAPIGVYDFTKTLTLTSTSYSAVSSLYQSLINYNYNLNLSTEVTNSIPYPPGGNSGSLSWSGLGTWASSINTIQQGTNAAITFALPSNQQPGYPATGTTDFYNSGQSGGLTLVYTGGSIATVPYLSTFRFTWAAGTGTYGTWSYSASAPPYGTANNTTFQINQNITNTNISTSDTLTLTGTSININGPLTANSATFANVSITDSLVLPSTVVFSTVTATTFSGGNATMSSIITGVVHATGAGGSIYIDSPSAFLSTQTVYTSQINTPLVSSLTQINSRSIKLLYNPGDVIVFSKVNQASGNNWWEFNVDFRNMKYGVYNCVATCNGNPFRSLSCIMNWSALYGCKGQMSSGFDNNNGVLWVGGGVYATFKSQTDGQGDNFDFEVWWISGQINALGDLPPDASTITTVSTGTFTPTVLPWITQLSSILTTSSITIGTDINLSINAALPVPTFLGAGTIALNASTNVDLMANKDITLGAAHDINATATSNMSLTAPNIYLNGTIRAFGTLEMYENNIGNVKDIYLRRNLIFQSTTTYIADLSHIYGNTSAYGGGLGIDYMYGLFFNSSGNNANLYASGGTLNMTSFNGGININTYNSTTTGSLSLYSDKNELFVATGANHDVVINGGRGVAINSANADGFFNVYTSTVNSQSLLDTNVTVGVNYNIVAPNINVTGALNMVTGALNMSNHNITNTANLQVSSINSAAYPPPASIVSSYTNLYTSTLNGNPNYLTLKATRSITISTLSTFVNSLETVFTGDIKVSSINSAAYPPSGGGGSWVSTATSALNMGSYPINGNGLTINSATATDFNIKNTVGSGGAMNIVADTYMYFNTRNQDMYFDPHTDMGGNVPGNINFGANRYYAYSNTGMYINQYGTSGAGLNIDSSDRLRMSSSDEAKLQCRNYTVDLYGLGGVTITDSNTGGSGVLTVSASNHLYWNGVLIA